MNTKENSINPEWFDQKYIDRFWSKVDVKNDPEQCWLWKEGTDKDGYGKYQINHASIRSHRYAYLITNKTLSKNLCILHKCDNPACVNPNHLFQGSTQMNVQDRVSKNRSAIGERIYANILSAEQASEIKRLYVPHVYGYNKLAEQFKVDRSTICDIIKGRTFKYVK